MREGYWINNEITYTCLDSETIEITQKHVGTIRYLDGTDLIWHTSYTESHYVAFSTDWDIDKLMEADVSWTQRSYTATGLTIMWEVLILPVNTSYGSTEYKEKTLSCEDPTIYTDQYGLFGRSYDWERIQSVDEFIEQEGEILNDDVKNKVEKMQWVLRFHETPFDHNIHAVDVQTGTKVDDVTILRLKFETDGVVYNLGVVDNKQSGSIIPDNSDDLQDKFRLIIALVLLVLLVVLLAPFLPMVINVVVAIIKTIFKILLFILSLPFKLLKVIFKKRE